jgi:hypothetical protein
MSSQLTIKVDLGGSHVRRVPFTTDKPSLENLKATLEALLGFNKHSAFEFCAIDTDETVGNAEFNAILAAFKKEGRIPRVRVKIVPAEISNDRDVQQCLSSGGDATTHTAAQTACWFGQGCTRKGCWFTHPQGRQMDSVATNERHRSAKTPQNGSVGADEDFLLALHLADLQQSASTIRSPNGDHAMAVRLQQELDQEEHEGNAAGLAVQASGIGAEIVSSSNGTSWGQVTGDEGNVWRLASGRIAKKTTEGTKWRWSSHTGCDRFGTGLLPQRRPLSIHHVQCHAQHVKAGGANHLINRVLAIKCAGHRHAGGKHEYADALVEKVNPDGTLFVRWLSDGSVSMRVATDRVRTCQREHNKRTR